MRNESEKTAFFSGFIGGLARAMAIRKLGEVSAELERAKPGVQPSELRPNDGYRVTLKFFF